MSKTPLKFMIICILRHCSRGLRNKLPVIFVTILSERGGVWILEDGIIIDEWSEGQIFGAIKV